MSEGHATAGQYPLWKLSLEVDLAEERVNNKIKSDAVVTSLAVAAHKGKKAAKAFKEALENI